MAQSDYRTCDRCGSRAFYDAILNIEYAESADEWRKSAKYCGELDHVHQGILIDFLGDWAVLCQDCAKTHKTAIVPIEENEGE